eukprot:3954162-Pleurochrysis_carterae.AAC.1
MYGTCPSVSCNQSARLKSLTGSGIAACHYGASIYEGWQSAAVTATSPIAIISNKTFHTDQNFNPITYYTFKHSVRLGIQADTSSSLVAASTCEEAHGFTY